MRKQALRGGALCALLLALGAPAQASQELFQQHCSACHGANAEGIPGLAPPLVHEALWQGLGDNAVSYITGVMASGLSGQISAQGQLYIGLIMPPQAHQSSAELAEVANYVLTRNGVSHSVSAADVEAARSNAKPHSALRDMRPKNL